VTVHFTLEEFQASDTARSRGINSVMPSILLTEAQKTLRMLEDIRAELTRQAGHDVPMRLSSGYRSPALNFAVRRPRDGAGIDATGDHPLAAAADWTAPAFGTPLQICRALAPRVGVLGIGQLIYEGTWVHASTRMAKPGNRIITKTASGYTAGIVGA